MNPILQQFDITGRIALISGSSTGIGFALARAGVNGVLTSPSKPCPSDESDVYFD